jgi:adenylate kinase
VGFASEETAAEASPTVEQPSAESETEQMPARSPVDFGNDTQQVAESSTTRPRVGFAAKTEVANSQTMQPEAEPELERVEPALHLLAAASQLDGSSPKRRLTLESLRRESSVEVTSAAEDAFLSPTTRRKRVVLVAGAPCTGKGTQCDYIVSRYGLVHISPGEILREHVRRDTELGRKAAPFMERGELVPTDVVLAIVKERLSRPDVTNRGCVLNNFPLTSEQAEAMQRSIQADLFIELEVPRERLVERARGRRIDPHTGTIYHTEFHPPPPEAIDRLEQRSDDAESLIGLRLEMHDLHIAEITPWFESVRHRVQGDRSASEVFSSIAALLDDHGWGATESTPYIGSKAFGGAFSSTDARRGGFFSTDEPPDEGDQVACFQRGENFGKQGAVSEIEMLESDGTLGLLRGMVGVWVTVRYEATGTISSSTAEFQTWAEYLAPVNDMEYSSICDTRKYLASNYRRLCHTSPTELQQLPPAVPVQDAQMALKLWLENLVDSDGEPVALKAGVCDELVQTFASRTVEQSPSLYLYSTDTTIAPRISLTLGLDYSKCAPPTLPSFIAPGGIFAVV